MIYRVVLTVHHLHLPRGNRRLECLLKKWLGENRERLELETIPLARFCCSRVQLAATICPRPSTDDAAKATRSQEASCLDSTHVSTRIHHILVNYDKVDAAVKSLLYKTSRLHERHQLFRCFHLCDDLNLPIEGERSW